VKEGRRKRKRKWESERGRGGKGHGFTAILILLQNQIAPNQVCSGHLLAAGVSGVTRSLAGSRSAVLWFVNYPVSQTSILMPVHMALVGCYIDLGPVRPA